jgi:hypothetical protein
MNRHNEVASEYELSIKGSVFFSTGGAESGLRTGYYMSWFGSRVTVAQGRGQYRQNKGDKIA